MKDPTELVERYVAVWNEPDTARRGSAIRRLWTADGRQLLQPPQEIRKAAAELGVTASLEARGHEDLESRVSRSYEEFIAPGELVFRQRDSGVRLGDVVTFGWELARVDNGEVLGGGLEFLLLADDGRIRIDYQFIDG